MKSNFNSRFILAICTATLFCLSFNAAQAQEQMVQGNLEYMISESPERIFEIAKAENKPVLIYIHSKSCFASKKFSRAIMNHDKVKGMIKKKYVCMNADISTKFGKQMAAKHGILLMPALVLYSPDKDIMVQCKLAIDTVDMMSQFRAFVSASNLIAQIKLQQATSDKSDKEIIRQIGRSYAMKDFQHNRELDANMGISMRTLNIDYFREFEVGYKEEWETLVANNGKSNAAVTASK